MGAGRSLPAAIWLGARSLLWIVLLPGMISGYVPWRYFGLGGFSPDVHDTRQIAGLLVIGAGAALLLTCVWEFARSGRGTLSPVDPPTELVIQGLYRYVRNPMYVGVSAIVLGEALLMRSGALLLYWAGFFTAANLFVMFYEEPALRSRFGSSYDAYTRRVRRWIPTFQRERPPA